MCPFLEILISCPVICLVDCARVSSCFRGFGFDLVKIRAFLACRTASGTFQDGDLRLNQRGLRLISEEKETRVSSSQCFRYWCIFVLVLMLSVTNWAEKLSTFSPLLDLITFCSFLTVAIILLIMAYLDLLSSLLISMTEMFLLHICIHVYIVKLPCFWLLCKIISYIMIEISMVSVYSSRIVISFYCWCCWIEKISNRQKPFVCLSAKAKFSYLLETEFSSLFLIS